MPAIWFKFRREHLRDIDRECVILIRQLANHLNDLEEITASRSTGWRSKFENIISNVNHQSPPREQGRQAARLFRQERGLAQGSGGIGDLIRTYLRVLGVLVVENSISESAIEGCAFFVGQRPSDRPCIFGNTYASEWHRRNVVIGHELGHLIFDSQSEGASIDLHALSTAEYFQKTGLEKARPFAGKRTTTIPSRKLMLPVGYITRVLDAVSNEQISPSKAAEMLMIDEDSFRERFPAVWKAAEEALVA
jgi:hypothetical protein